MLHLGVIEKRSILLFSTSSVIVAVFQLAFYFFVIHGYKFTEDAGKGYYFWCGLASLLILSVYTGFVTGNKIRSLYSPFLLLFVLVSTYLAYLFYEKSDSMVVVYLLFLQSQISRLLTRIETGGFPAVTYILSAVMIFFSLQKVSIIYIPLTYFVIQFIENVLAIKYKILLELYEGLFLRLSNPIFLMFLLVSALYDSVLGVVVFSIFIVSLLILVTRDYFTQGSK